MFDKQPSGEFQLPAELAALEKQLAELAPAAVRVDRDRLMFAAGRSAAAGGSPSVARPQAHAAWFWPAATAMMTAATILLAVTLAWESSVDHLAAKPQAEAVVGTRDDAQAEPSDEAATNYESVVSNRGAWPWSVQPTSGYLGLRYVALTQGVGAIGGRPIAANGAPDEPSPPATARELLEELLPAVGRASS